MPSFQTMLKAAFRQTGLLLTIVLALPLISCVQKEKSAPDRAERPNIILFFTDELQFKDIGFCGGPIPTPQIDALAADGMYFENTYTPAPMCTPSRYAVLSGRYPGRCSDEKFLEDYPTSGPYNISWNTHLDSTVMTIPRILSAQGYVTGMVGKWHVSRGAFPGGLLKRKADPADPAVNEALAKHQALARAKVMHDGGFDVAKSVMFGNYDGFAVEALRVHHYPWFNKGALDFIGESAVGDKPFFLYLAATSLHGPHHADELVRDYSYTPEGRIEGMDAYKLDVQQLSAEIGGMDSPESHRYAGMAFLDHQVGLVLAKLEELGIAENTVLVFLPDHNTEPGKSTCYEKGVKIPMFIKWPGKIDPGSRTQAKVQNIDLLPTILEMAGAVLPEGYSIDGKSMMPVIRDPGQEFKKYIFLESGFTRSVFDGSYKYIAFRYPDQLVQRMERGEMEHAPTHVASPGGIPVVNMAFYPSYWDSDQLFDLSNDPCEQHNLAADPAYAEKMADLQAVLQEHLAGFDHPFDLAPQAFMHSEEFRELKEVTARQKPEDIGWYVRDWGKITWPPEKGNGL